MPRGSSTCARFLWIALFITAVMPSARGQCPTPESIPNASPTGATPLTVQTPMGEVPDCEGPPGSGFQYPNTVTINVNGAPGTWIYVHIRAFIELPPNPTAEQQSTFDGLSLDYKWLAKGAWPLSDLEPSGSSPLNLVPEFSYTTQPQHNLYQASSVVADFYNRAVKVNEPDLVKWHYQPIVGLGALADRHWIVNAPLWVDNENLPQNPKPIWARRLADVAESECFSENWSIYSVEKLVENAVFEQVCYDDAKEFLNSGRGAAIEQGLLKLKVQPIGVMDYYGPLAYLDNENLITALPSVQGPSPTGPRIRIGAGSLVTVPTRTPHVGSGLFHGNVLAPEATMDGIVVPMAGTTPPIEAVVIVAGRQNTLTGEYHAPGRVRFATPPACTPGTQIRFVSITNRFGTISATGEPWEYVTVQ